MNREMWRVWRVVIFSLGLLNASSARADEKTAAESLSRAKTLIARGESGLAVKQLSNALGANPQLAEAYYLRGRENFRISKFKDSLADFDAYVQLQPNRRASLWERGITCYYAEEFLAGAKQFELYQTYLNNDVENATWRYLCLARDPQTGLEKARQTLLPITNDRRVPMMQIYAMYRGKMTPHEVLKAARGGEPTEAELRQRLFYAHLYIGLYEEVGGRAASAKSHLQLAAEKYPINHYMGDVARVHWKRFQVMASP